jgi:hypothetical protein
MSITDDLLEACKLSLQLRALESSILSGKYHLIEVRKFRDEARGIEQKIRAAIAKAEGEQS